MPFARALLWALLAALLGLQVVQIAGIIVLPSWIPYNGYFQNANPVERLCLGQWPGRDFDPYLGLGTSWLAWPAAALLGCDPQTIDAVYQILTRTVLAAAFAGIGWAAGLRGPSTLILFSGLLLVQIGLGGILPLLGLPTFQILNPSVSLFGIRAATPLLLVSAVAGLLPRLSPYAGWALGGAAAALGALLAPDSGAAALVGVGALLLVHHLFRHGPDLRSLTVGVGTATLASLAIFSTGATLLTGGAPITWLDWLFGEMRTAQRWIFAYDPEAVATAWQAPIRHPGTLLLLLLGGLLATRPGARPEALIGLVAATLAAGWGPYLGGQQNDRYLSIIDLVCAALAIVAAVREIPTTRASLAAAGFAAVALPVAVLTLPNILAPWQGPSVPTPWGGRSHPSWQPLWDLGAKLKADGGPLVSLYRGPLDRAAGAPPTGRQDYLIHAFSDGAIETWRQAVANARWIVTLAPETNTLGRWMERVYWPVLRDIHLGHNPYRDVGPLRLWDIRTTRLVPNGRPVACRIDIDGLIRISSDGLSEPFLAEISVEIPSARRPIAVERSPVIPSRTPAGSYALRPGQTTHHLPVDLVPGAETTLEIRDGAGRLYPISCSAQLFLPRASLTPDPGPLPEKPYTAEPWTLKHPDGTIRHRITLVAADPTARLPYPGERIDACPHLPIRHVQWIREARVVLVLAEERTQTCLPERTRTTVRLIPPEPAQ